MCQATITKHVDGKAAECKQISMSHWDQEQLRITAHHFVVRCSDCESTCASAMGNRVLCVGVDQQLGALQSKFVTHNFEGLLRCSRPHQ